jgi:hypothetical protein
MRKSLLGVAAALSMSAVDVHAQVPLSTYTDANGYLDVQKLTCGQLAGTFQEDADLLVAWYSGWYNGLAKSDRAKKLEHEIIVHCAKPIPAYALLIAIAVIFKDERMRLGIKLAQ